MRKMNLSQYDYSNLLDEILKILLRQGIKTTTMDDIAISLSISKRTLYEIFVSKNAMAAEVMARFHHNMLARNVQFQKSAPTVMHSILKSFVIYREVILNMNVDFFRDFDALPPDVRAVADEAEKNYMQNFISLLDHAAEEGYIRDGIDYRLLFRIAQVQFTLVKCQEELFPPDISLMQVYDATASGFCRCIVSTKGLQVLQEASSFFDINPKPSA